MHTYAYGFPRLGIDRYYKKCIEMFWKGEISQQKLISGLEEIEKERLSLYREKTDFYPLGEMSFYDHMLDTAFMLGLYRFKDMNEYYEYARGRKALVMKKYFNTNYHYLVPHIKREAKFSPDWSKPLHFLDKSDIQNKPLFLLGPYTFLKLSKIEGSFAVRFAELCDIYKKLIESFAEQGISSLHMEEPAFALDVPENEIKLIIKIYKKLTNECAGINLITYYDSISFLKQLYDLPFKAIALDFVAGKDNIDTLKKYGFPKDKNLICGVIDGKNPRRADILEKAALIANIKKACKLDDEKIYIANSCPLQHLPVTLENETTLGKTLLGKISFAKERLHELYLVKEVLNGRTEEARKWSKPMKETGKRYLRKVFNTMTLSSRDFTRRRAAQKKNLNLPMLPTTTMGSFPQDRILRKKRSEYKNGVITNKKYTAFLRQKINSLIRLQENIGLDVLVHGEFERTDMVEYFAQKLKGLCTTRSGWVISYGTRIYRPPIIHGEVKRTRALTKNEILYAQKLTKKPVKGVFTGPVTILAWSYNLRQDPPHIVAFELAKALNDEARELVKNNISLIQIDEPAILEYAPLKKAKKKAYFSWAVRAFNDTAKLPKNIQVHTHMCYSEFGDIIEWILKMNFDVITVEAAREDADIVTAFRGHKFNRQIGPGLWDIHSKHPAEKKKMKQLLEKMIKIFGRDNIWLNPDCGLKTRNWPEVEISLKRITELAREYRDSK